MDVAINVRRNGRLLCTKYMSEHMSVCALVQYIARGAKKIFLHSTFIQDVSFMRPEFLKRSLGSYRMGVLTVECTECQNKENHLCQLDHLGMCVAEEERYGVIDLVSEEESEETATTEEYSDDDSMPPLISDNDQSENQSENQSDKDSDKDPFENVD